MGALDGWRIGWIGVGRMGTPITRNLMRAGAVVTVCDPDAARVAAAVAAGAREAASPAALAAEADIVCSMVPNDKVLLAVAGQIGTVLRDDQVFVDLSTVSPGASAEAAALLAQGAFLRSPVSGSTSTAEAGALTLFCSGPRAAYERCGPMLDAIGSKRMHVGEGDEARALKLLINMIVAVTPALLGEALAFGRLAGLDWATMVDAIGQSVVASPLVAYKLDTMRNRDWTPAATVDLVAKDLDLALDVARQSGAPVPIAALARQFAAACQASGEGGLDFFRTVTWPERLLAPNPK